VDTLSSLSIGSLTVAPGINLRYAQARTPVQPALGTVLLLQGRGEFIEKYVETASELLSSGYHIVTFDWRGQGLSSRLIEDRQKGHIDSYDTHLDDLNIIISTLVKPLEGRAVYALAHSMGGHILARYLDRHPDVFDAVLLSAPMIDITGNAIQRLALLSLSYAAVKLGFGKKYALGMRGYGDADRDFAKNRRTHDQTRFHREVQAIADNPDLALGGVTWGWLYATSLSISRLRSAAGRGDRAVPVMIFSAGEEKIVNNPAQHDYSARLPRATIHTIEHAYHEILQEKDHIRQVFWAGAHRFLHALQSESEQQARA
jgi:lysophospholipase